MALNELVYEVADLPTLSIVIRQQAAEPVEFECSRRADAAP